MSGGVSELMGAGSSYWKCV